MKKQLVEKKGGTIRRIFNRLIGKRPVHILHIGKTGGTVIKEALKSHLLAGKFKIELHDHNFKLRDVPEGEQVVFFLRDPVKRFISGFYSRKRKGQPKYNFPWSPGEEEAFGNFNTPNSLAMALTSEDKNLQESAINAMKSIYHVNTSYWDWFENEKYFISRFSDILFVGFQENLEANFTTLKRMLYLPDTLKLLKDEVVAHRNPSNLDTHLDQVAISNLMNWYKKDYDFYEYCEEKFKQINVAT